MPRPDRSARLRADRSRMEVDGVDLWRMRDGRIARLPRVLRHERRGAPARHRAGAGQPRRAGERRAAATAGAHAAPMSARGDYDVAIVGASVAGCTAARLLAQRGARVALIEQRPGLDAYKTVCTHYIQSSATPTIERLGLARADRGARRGAQRDRHLDAVRRLDPRRAATRRTATTSPAARSTRCCASWPPTRPASSSCWAGRATALLGNGRPDGRRRSRTAARERRAIARAARGGRRRARLAGRAHGRRAAAGCGRTTASSTGPTGAACGPRPASARGCGSWSPTAPTRSRTRTA